MTRHVLNRCEPCVWQGKLCDNSCEKKDKAMSQDFQSRVDAWMAETFANDVGADTKERGFRFGEEAVELLQANGCTKEDVLKLVDYVYGRPVGEFGNEVGGTLVTLAALCSARRVRMLDCGHAEVNRVNTPEVRAKIQAKQAMKRAVMGHTPLPGSAL